MFLLFSSAWNDIFCVHSQSYTHIFRLAKPHSNPQFLPQTPTNFPSQNIQHHKSDPFRWMQRERERRVEWECYTQRHRKRFSWYDEVNYFIFIFCCLLPQLMLELVMLCFVCFGLGFFRLCLLLLCINLYSFYYTQGSQEREEREENLSYFLRLWFFFLSFLVSVISSFYFSCSGLSGVVWEAFTRLIFVGNFSTINVSTKRKKKKHTNAPKA
jgi:hypothetical protein